MLQEFDRSGSVLHAAKSETWVTCNAPVMELKLSTSACLTRVQSSSSNRALSDSFDRFIVYCPALDIHIYVGFTRGTLYSMSVLGDKNLHDRGVKSGLSPRSCVGDTRRSYDMFV